MATSLIYALRCPITGEMMKDPAILVCSGLSYERVAIEDWIRENGTDPESGEPLQDMRLIQNPCLKALIERVVARQL